MRFLVLIRGARTPPPRILAPVMKMPLWKTEQRQQIRMISMVERHVARMHLSSSQRNCLLPAVCKVAAFKLRLPSETIWLDCPAARNSCPFDSLPSCSNDTQTDIEANANKSPSVRTRLFEEGSHIKCFARAGTALPKSSKTSRREE